MRHRAPEPFRSTQRAVYHDDVRTDAYPLTFRPRHCAGETCFHQHPGEAPWPTFQQFTGAAS